MRKVKTTIKSVSFITISVLLVGCAGNSVSKTKHNSNDGLVNTIQEKQNINKLINSSSNVKTVFNQIVRKQGMDKYESSTEYLKRMSNLSTYAVMNIKIDKTFYNPDKKIYFISLDTEDRKHSMDRLSKESVIGYSYVKGTPNKEYSSTFKTLNLALNQSHTSGASHYTGSNVYGVSTRVTHRNFLTYKAHLDNILKLLNSKNVYLLTEKGILGGKHYYIGIPASKEQAKELDRQKRKLKIKMRVEIKNLGTSLYEFKTGSQASLDFPSSSNHASYGFDAHLKELVLFNTSSKNVLFQFAD